MYVIFLMHSKLLMRTCRNIYMIKNENYNIVIIHKSIFSSDWFKTDYAASKRIKKLFYRNMICSLWANKIYVYKKYLIKLYKIITQSDTHKKERKDEKINRNKMFIIFVVIIMADLKLNDSIYFLFYIF